MYQNPRQKSRILEAKYLFGIKFSFTIAVALLTACVWAQYFRLTSKNHIIPLSYRIFTFASAICSVFLTSEIIHNPKTCSLRGGRHFLPPSCQWICLSAPFKHKLSFNATNITHFHSRSTYFIVKQYLVLRWSLLRWWRTKTGRQYFRLLITSFQFTVAFFDSSDFSNLQSLAAIFLTMNYLDGKAEMMT